MSDLDAWILDRSQIGEGMAVPEGLKDLKPGDAVAVRVRVEAWVIARVLSIAGDGSMQVLANAAPFTRAEEPVPVEVLIRPAHVAAIDKRASRIN